MSSDTPIKHRNAFTLTELLVVISVITVLMALLIPGLHAARKQGKRAACMGGRLRQLHLAWAAYAEENDGRIVPDWIFSTDPSIRILWAYKRTFEVQPFEERTKEGLLWPYIESLEAYACPASPSLRSDYHGSKVHYLVSRTLEAVYRGPGLEPPSPHPIYCTLTSDVESPSERMVFFDLGIPKGNKVGPYFGENFTSIVLPGGDIPVPEDSWVQYEFPPIHHSNGTNLSFADGHIEYWKWKDPRTIKLGHDHGSGLYTDPQPDNPDLKRLKKAIWGKDGVIP